MKVENALYPEQEVLRKMLKQGYTGPVCMLNLLKYRDKAEYPDGRDADLPGAEAYGRYGSEMGRIVRDAGGRFVFSAQVLASVIGQVQPQWDAMAVVEYPSFSDFVRIVSLPEVEGLQEHRRAGLEGQLLIMTQEQQSSFGD